MPLTPHARPCVGKYEISIPKFAHKPLTKIHDMLYAVSICLYSVAFCLTNYWYDLPNDAISWRRPGNTMDQVMVCCLMVPSHHLNNYCRTQISICWRRSVCLLKYLFSKNMICEYFMLTAMHKMSKSAIRKTGTSLSNYGFIKSSHMPS